MLLCFIRKNSAKMKCIQTWRRLEISSPSCFGCSLPPRGKGEGEFLCPLKQSVGAVPQIYGNANRQGRLPLQSTACSRAAATTNTTRPKSWHPPPTNESLGSREDRISQLAWVGERVLTTIFRILTEWFGSHVQKQSPVSAPALSASSRF